MPPKKKSKFEPASPLPDVEWQVAASDRSSWLRMPSSLADLLEAQFSDEDKPTTRRPFPRGSKIPEEIGFSTTNGGACGYDFSTMMIDDGSLSLPIRRLTKASWEWIDDNGLYVPFYDEDNLIIERAWRRCANTFEGKNMSPGSFQTTNLSFNVGYDSTYTFLFNPPGGKGEITASQKNEESGRVRDLRRADPDVACPVWDTKGFGISGMKMPDVEVSSSGKESDDAKAVAKDDDDDDGDTDGQETKTGVVVVPSTIFDPPACWEAQSSNIEFFTVPEKSAEYKEVLAPFFKTMFGKPTIRKVTRIQNQMLWRFYALTRYKVAMRNDGDPTERKLFHGARVRENMDAITNFGFDMRVARDGLAGIGIYFATNASYSNAGYVYSHPDGSREMYICRVACGSDAPGKHGMKRPPNRTGKKKDEFYDSVSRGSPKNMYVVFDNSQAYPEYIVHYKP